MKTPIYDFISNYRAQNPIRLHMPGHKGTGRLGCEALDITEISGADSLYENSSEGIIAASEKNASALFGTGRTLYSTEGASQCIKAMLYLTILARGGRGQRTILAARNAHKAFVHACALLDLSPHWLYSEHPGDPPYSCRISPESLRRELENVKTTHGKQEIGRMPLAVYITAPDYLGYSPDIAGLAAVCREFDLPLLVDNAHGAYLKFLPVSRHPIDLGAFISTDSAHKTLPVLTGGAYLQLSPSADFAVGNSAKEALLLFGSTSPSYLTLQSLDLCCAYLADKYPERLAAHISLIDKVKAQIIRAGFSLLDTTESDPLKIVLAAGNYDGRHLADRLRECCIECEYADMANIVLMSTPENTPEQLGALCRTLEGFLKHKKSSEPAAKKIPSAPRNECKMSPREVLFYQREIVPAAESVGKICAAPAISCPPGVPIAVCGELISPECAELFKIFEITSVEVVKGIYNHQIQT